MTYFSYQIQNFENAKKKQNNVKELVIVNQHAKFQTDMSIFSPKAKFSSTTLR